MRRGTSGFTLVELMVVLVILGLMSSAVLLVMPDPRGRLSDDAERFAGRVRAAHDRAVILGRPVALWVSASGYGFEERRQGRWQMLEERPLNPTDWPSGSTAAVRGARVRLVFDSIGRADQPIAFRLTREDAGVSVMVGLDGRTRIGGP